MTNLKSKFQNIINNPDEIICSKRTIWQTNTLKWLANTSKKAFVITGMVMVSQLAYGQSNDVNTEHNLKNASQYVVTILPGINIQISEYSDLKTASPTTQAQKNLNNLADISQKASMTASVFPNKIFNKDSNRDGMTCYITTNSVLLKEDFKKIQQATGMEPKKLSELLIRHEYAHCIQQGLEYKTLTEYQQTDNIEYLNNPILTAKLRNTALNIKHSIIPNEITKDDYALNILMQSMSTTDDVVKREVFADGLALVSLYTEGKLTLDEVNTFIQFRQSEFESTHDDSHNTGNMVKQIFKKSIDTPVLKGNMHLGNTPDIKEITNTYIKTWFDIAQPHNIQNYNISYQEHSL